MEKLNNMFLQIEKFEIWPVILQRNHVKEIKESMRRKLFKLKCRNRGQAAAWKTAIIFPQETAMCRAQTCSSHLPRSSWVDFWTARDTQETTLIAFKLQVSTFRFVKQTFKHHCEKLILTTQPPTKRKTNSDLRKCRLRGNLTRLI